jgi:hypothetical protein
MWSALIFFITSDKSLVMAHAAWLSLNKK